MSLDALPDAPADSTTGAGWLRLGLRLVFLGLLVSAAHQVITQSIRHAEVGQFGVWNRIVEGRINVQLLISGSSRALNHYDPRILQATTGRTAFNIGLNGSQTDMQLARLKTYLAHNAKPDLIVQNLDLFSLQMTHGAAYDAGQYTPYLDQPALFDALRRIQPSAWKSKYLPLYGYAVDDTRFTWLEGLAAAAGRPRVDDRFLGFMPRDLPWTSDFDRFKSSHLNGVKVDIEPEGVEQLRSLVRLCQERQISLLLVYSPEYREMQNLTTNRREIFDLFAQLAREQGIALWDYSADPLSTDRSAFYNSQHLNAQGAARFSASLAERIRKEFPAVDTVPWSDLSGKVGAGGRS